MSCNVCPQRPTPPLPPFHFDTRPHPPSLTPTPTPFLGAQVGVSCRRGGSFFSKRAKGFHQVERPYLLAVEDPNDPENDLGRNSYNVSRVGGWVSGWLRMVGGWVGVHACAVGGGAAWWVGG